MAVWRKKRKRILIEPTSFGAGKKIVLVILLGISAVFSFAFLLFLVLLLDNETLASIALEFKLGFVLYNCGLAMVFVVATFRAFSSKNRPPHIAIGENGMVMRARANSRAIYRLDRGAMNHIALLEHQRRYQKEHGRIGIEFTYRIFIRKHNRGFIWLHTFSSAKEAALAAQELSKLLRMPIEERSGKPRVKERFRRRPREPDSRPFETAPRPGDHSQFVEISEDFNHFGATIRARFNPWGSLAHLAPVTILLAAWLMLLPVARFGGRMFAEATNAGVSLAELPGLVLHGFFLLIVLRMVYKTYKDVIKSLRRYELALRSDSLAITNRGPRPLLNTALSINIPRDKPLRFRVDRHMNGAFSLSIFTSDPKLADLQAFLNADSPNLKPRLEHQPLLAPRGSSRLEVWRILSGENGGPEPRDLEFMERFFSSFMSS